MKQAAITIYVAILVLVLGVGIALVVTYKDDIGNLLDGKETFDFTAEMVKNKTFKRDDGGVTIYMGDNLSLYSSANAQVYAVTFKDKDGKAAEESLPAEDGYTFKYLIALNGSTPVWNLANTSNKTLTYDLYYTISDGSGLTIDDNLYYAKGGAVEVLESEIQVYDKNGKKLALTGDTENSLKQLGKPYKVSFMLDPESACVIKASANRLVIYGINAHE